MGAAIGENKMSITIWAKGETKHMTLQGGRPYSYQEDIGQKTFSFGWGVGGGVCIGKSRVPKCG